MTTTPNTPASGAADSPKLRLLLDSFPEQNPRNFDPDAAIQLNEWGIAIVEELYRLRALAASAPVAPAPPKLFLNGFQLRAALDFIAPDGDDEQLESEVCIQHGPERTHDEGTEAAGMYCWLSDYPDEGSIRLDDEATPEAAPVAPAPQPADTSTAVLQWIVKTASEAKEPCGENPESPAAIRNAKLAAIAGAAAQALGIVRGPSYDIAAPQPAVPDGFVLVPVEPTQEMEAAAYRNSSTYGGGPGADYRAMIAAFRCAP